MPHPSEKRPIEREYLAKMNRVAAALDEGFKPYGFCLLVFPLDGAEGRVNYISNTERSTMLTAMKEFIARNEGRAGDSEASH